MKSVFDLCKPRKSVFVDTTREDVLNLSDLVEGNIDAQKFFAENFMTKGMDTLLHTAFRRFQGKSDTGVIKLTQAMGGGKTHNMLALALLAQNKNLRKKVLNNKYDDVNDIKVIAFSGRESDAELGIWGSLAEQLGKKDVFAGLYTPLRAPGESAWIKLLQGQKVLILLDELPPYLENAKSIAIGNSDLCKVTITALSNLFNAIGKEKLANVCLVFSDLKATYESGSALLQSSFKELEQEANRVAINIEPVALNTDEIYDILRTKLFEEFPASNDTDVLEIAKEYKEAVKHAGKSGLTNYSADKVYLGVRDSYPFHPSIKDLYARFKENQNFQQTRGLIRLMRQIVRQFYDSGLAKEKSLIGVYDIDLNNATLLNFIHEIKPSLDNAINHDVAQHGKAVAETIDAEYAETHNYPYAQMLAKLLLMSSLNDTANGLLGLNDNEILGFLCEPGIDLNQFNKVLEEIKTQCWYLKMDNRGRYYFQETKNMVAEMNALVDSYSNEQARKELRAFLAKNFAAKLKNCYQNLYVMPAVDEIALDRDKVTLVIYEPYGGSTLHPDLAKFYENATFQNRVMFLSGQRSIMEKLYENSKKLTAIEQIIGNMKEQHLPESDQQYKEANNQRDKAIQALLSTIRETFVTLYYPAKGGLQKDDFKLEFKENKFDGEEQIVKTLKDNQKFIEFTNNDKQLETLRKKCESRIFTQKEMLWSQILERAATETVWQWLHPDQMDTLLKNCCKKDLWRRNGEYVVKGPFEKEATQVTVEQMTYDENTLEFNLKIRGVHGTTIYYEIGAEPSTASAVVENPNSFITKETELYFLCVDSSTDNPHPTGKAVHFFCKVPLKHKLRESSQGRVMRFKTHPSFEIRYTTDGSNPKESGARYVDEFLIPNESRFVLVAVYNNGELVEEKQISIEAVQKPEPIKIDPVKPVRYTLHKMRKCTDTEMTYKELASFQKFSELFITYFTVEIAEKNTKDNYLEVNTSTVPYDAANLQATVDLIRETAFAKKDVTVLFSWKTLLFLTGEEFKKWIETNRFDLNELRKNGDIVQ